jgi:LPS export ABC transporter protein LptC
MNIKIAVALWATAVFVLFPACTGQKKPMAEAITNRDSLPSMRTLGVTTLISDSGITRYKIITKEWDIYDKLDPSYWAFEQGIYLEKFDTLMHKDATIKADTAYYYDGKKLWELRGHVHIQNQKGDKFDTELLFWSEKLEKVYSDKFIRIETEDRLLTGYGFESNQQLTDYTIYNNAGVFEVEQKPDTASVAARDSIPTDTLKVNTKP